MSDDEATWISSKENLLGFNSNNDLKSVLHALSRHADVCLESSVRDMITENETLTGQIAEAKAQHLEVLRSSYIQDRVDEEIAPLLLEQDIWLEENRTTQLQIENIRAEIKELDEGMYELLPLKNLCSFSELYDDTVAP